MMKLYDVRTEYRRDPIGLSVECPRFSWKIQSDLPNTVQTHYQLFVKTADIVVWDSGRVASDRSVLIPYQGEPLKGEGEQ